MTLQTSVTTAAVVLLAAQRKWAIIQADPTNTVYLLLKVTSDPTALDSTHALVLTPGQMITITNWNAVSAMASDGTTPTKVNIAEEVVV
jgi:hypothetical protein